MRKPEHANRLPSVAAATLIIGISATPLLLWNDLLDPALTFRFLYLTFFGAGFTLLLRFNLGSKFSSTLSEVVHWKNPLFICILIWLIATILSLGVALQKSESYVEAARVGFFLLSYIWVATWVKVDNRVVIWLSIGFCITAFLLCCFGISDFVESFLKLTVEDSYYPMSGRMGNRNLLAIMISLCLPFHFIVFTKYKSAPVRIAVALNFFLGVSVVMLTSSRIGWLSITVMLIYCFAALLLGNRYGLFEKSFVRKSLGAFLLFAVAILIPLSVLYLKNPASAENLSQRLKSFVNFKSEKNIHTESIAERLHLWSNSLELIKEHPLIGVGAGNWKFVIPEKGLSGRSETGEITFLQPHNDFIWVFAETGVFGGLSFVSLFAIAIVYIIRSFRQGRGEVVHLALLLGIILYAVQSFFDFPKERPLILFTFTCLLAMVSAEGERGNQKPSSKKSFQIMMSLLFAGVALASSLWLIRMQGERYLKKAIAARQTGNYGRMKKELEKINPAFFESDLMGTPVDWYRSEVAYSQGDLKAFKKYSERALQLNPYQLYNLYNLGSIYYRQGDVATSIQYWERAIKIAPRFTDAAVNLSAAYYNRGDFEKAALLLCKPEIDYRNEMYSMIVFTVLGKYINLSSDTVGDGQLSEDLRSLSVSKERLKNLQMRMVGSNEPLNEVIMAEAYGKKAPN